MAAVALVASAIFPPKSFKIQWKIKYVSTR
jgi:hypothetical protein